MGYILLEGGAEFMGQSAIADQRAIELAGDPEARITIVPAAAAPDNNHERAGNNGIQWFRSLGAVSVSSLPVVDVDSAANPDLAQQLQSSNLIFLLGGFPGHLADTLKHSLCWRAIKSAAKNGAVIAGSSAGAMVLCEHFYDPHQKRLRSGLNLLPSACVLPHHNTFGQKWARPLEAALPESVLIGIDEQTGMINEGSGGSWRVYGKGSVTLYRQGRIDHYAASARFTL